MPNKILEAVLRAANQKFVKRFNHVEQQVEQSGKSFQQHDLEKPRKLLATSETKKFRTRAEVNDIKSDRGIFCWVRCAWCCTASFAYDAFFVSGSSMFCEVLSRTSSKAIE